MEPKKTYKLDVFATLEQINRKNAEFYNDLTDEERKGFVPLIVMRWMSGMNSPLQIILLNEVVNPFVFSLFNHKDLLYKLLTVSSVKPQRYKWIKVKGKEHQHKHSIEVIRTHYGYSSAEAASVFPLLSSDTIMEMAEKHGLQKEELAKIKNELKNR